MTLSVVDAEKRVAMQHLDLALSDTEVIELATGFRLYGFWRMELDAGHVFATDDLLRIYGLEPHPGPVDIIAISAQIHPDDLVHLMQAFEQAGPEKPTYHSIFRVRTGANDFKFVRAVGKFRARPGTSGEVVGISYELFGETADEAVLMKAALDNGSVDPS